MNDFVPWVYIDDRGRGYITRALAEEVAQQTGDPLEPILGGRSPAGADNDFPPLPNSVRPRQVYLTQDGSAYTRTVRVFEPTAPILTADPRPTITMEDSDGAAHVMRFDHLIAENFGRKAKPNA